jgi:hypothetical protein
MMFGSRDDGGGRGDAVRRVKAWVFLHAGLEADDTVMVTELRCMEEGCPPIETVIAVLRQGAEPRRWKLHKRVVEVTEDDVRGQVGALGRDHP